MQAIIPAKISWNVMYLPLLVYASFYLARQLIKKKYKLLPFVGLILGIGLHIHFTVIFIALFFALAVVISKPKKEEIKEIVKGSVLALLITVLCLLPLILFDLKHQFMNTKLLINFFTQDNSDFYFNFGESWRVFKNSFDLFNLFDSFDAAAYFSLVIVTLAALSAYFFDRKNSSTALIWLFSPLLLFSFYRGNISEYYMTISTCIVILYAGLFFARITKFFVLLFSCLVILALLHLKTITSLHNEFGLYYQKEVIDYLNTQSFDPKFNLSYDLYLGWDAAFQYLAKRSDKYSTSDDGHLYVVVLHDSNPQSIKFGGFGLLRK